jgi:hypothetical protein
MQELKPIARHAALPHPFGLKMRSVEAGYFASAEAGRRGRANNSPPQFGHFPCRTSSAQLEQNVHSKVQMRAFVASGGRSMLQHSQLGLSCSMVFSRSKPVTHRKVTHRNIIWRRSGYLGLAL